MITSSQYTKYMRSLIKLLVGEKVVNEWIKEDFGPRQMENAAILCSSWQRPPMLIDPNNEGAAWLGRLNSLMNPRKLVNLDMETRSDPHVILTLEKAIMRGKPVLLRNCEESIDNIITPLMHHRNTAHENNRNEEPRMIKFCGRRILCHQDFRFYLSTPLPKPKFNPEIASTTTIINFGVSHDTLTEDLLTRCFARIRPELYRERILALKNVALQKKTLHHLSVTVRDRVLTNQEAIMGSAKAVKFITDFTNAKVELSNRQQETVTLIEDLDSLKDELYPLARRAAMLYAIIRSLQSVHREYQFSLAYFITLFDEAVGGELPEDFGYNIKTDEGYEDDDETSMEADRRPRMGSSSSHASRDDTGEKATTDKQTTGTKPEEGQLDGDLDEKQELTEESASTAAAQRLVAGTESEDLPALELPQTATLPSEGVDYSNISANTIKQLMDKLTGLVYRRVRESLYEDDCLLFATLLCLNIQAEGGENFTNEEMSLLLQGNPGLGMQLTLADFDCRDEAPDWLPREKWEDILALSVLPGPLDSLCVNFAQNTDAWKAWYKGDYPEREPLPLSLTGAGASMDTRAGSSQSTKSEKENESKSPDLGPLTEFHQLLLLRMLRPDRLPAALAKYINKYLTLNLPDQTDFNLHDTLGDATHQLGILLLLPEPVATMRSDPIYRLKLSAPPVEVLLKMAKTVPVSVEHVRIGEGSEVLVEEAIDSAEKSDGWVVIEDLHLAPPKFFFQLKKQLVRVYRSREKLRASSAEEKQSSNFCVWITSEPCARIPDFLLLNLHKVAWNNITMDVLTTDGSGGESTAESTVDGTEPPLAIVYRSPQTYLHSAIVSVMKLVPAKVWESVLNESQSVRNIAFAVAIIQAMLVARQMFGTAGLSQYYPFTAVQVSQAIGLVVSRFLKPTDEETGEPNKDTLSQLISQIVYENAAYSQFDQGYVLALIRNVLHNIYTDTSGSLVLGTVAIPTPPANVEPGEYAWWYEKNVDEEFTLAALQLHNSTEKEASIASSTEFVRRMDNMFETQNMEAGDVASSNADVVNIKRLRSSLDLAVEELPPLLELGQLPDAVDMEYDFPYHRPSILSLATASSTMMPETIGYVLLQECLWLNSVLCHIRQQISELQEQLLGGVEALPDCHITAVLSLQEEHVPVSWIHPNSQPCTHSLMSWLEDMRKRHEQLQSFVKCGMVPTFKAGQLDNPVIGHGRLTRIWLGGLVNPEALLTSLKQEKAVVSQCSIEDIDFECVVLDTDNVAEYDIDEGGLFITSVHIQGASWDYDNDCLAEATSALFNIPSIYLKPVLRSESPDKETQQNRSKKIYNCPVFINKSRQYMVTELQMNCQPPVDTWQLARTALILNPGLPEDGVKKSRSYLMNLRATAVMAAEGESEGESEEADEELEELEPDEESDNEEIGGGHSEPSQLSYRPMSPKAPPLPPGLSLLREPPMVDDEASSQPDRPKSKASQQSKTSQAARKTPTRTPTRTPTKTPTKTPPPKPGKSTPVGKKTPTLPAFSEADTKPADNKTPSPVAGGRASRASKGSQGRLSRASRKTVEVDDETRPFSQAHEDPQTQVEIEKDETDTARTDEGAQAKQDSKKDDNIDYQ